MSGPPNSSRFSRLFVAVLLGFGLLTTVSTRAEEPPSIFFKRAPELQGTGWLNTPDGKPITLASRAGKVTIVAFWTFGCINCMHNLPSYARWQTLFGKRDVAILAVHTPETEGERNPESVASHVKKLDITYPVLLDPKGENWNRWGVRYWPTVYVLDRQGRVRYGWEGELNYKGARGEALMAEHIDTLLKEKP